MFSRRIIKNLNPTIQKLSSSFNASFTSQYALPKASLDLTLLSPFDKSKTLKALKSVDQETRTQGNLFNPTNIQPLDKTGLTSFSQTFRAYDRESKILFAEKKILLDSDSSWNQVNLILKQYAIRSSNLADIYSINYDEKSQKVNVISEVNQTTLGDYSQFMTSHSQEWTDELLKSYTGQILSQIKNMRLLNATCESIKPQNMFIDEKSHNLKLFDLSDFTIESISERRDFSDIALKTLVQVLNPSVQVKSVEEAKTYLSKAYPSFWKSIEEVQKDSETWWTFNKQTQPDVLKIHPLYDAFITRRIGIPVDQTWNQTESLLEISKEEQEALDRLKEFKTNVETGFLQQIEAYNMLGNQKLTSEAYERFFKMGQDLLKAEAALKKEMRSPIDPLSEEKSSLGYKAVSGVVTVTASSLKFIFGFVVFILLSTFLLAGLMAILAGLEIAYEKIKKIVYPTIDEEKGPKVEIKDYKEHHHKTLLERSQNNTLESD